MKCVRLLLLVLKLSNSLVQQWPDHGAPLGVSFVEQRVQVGQQSVTNGQVMLGAVHQRRVLSKHSWVLMLEANIHCYYFQISQNTLANVWKAVSERRGSLGQLSSGFSFLLL